MLSRMERVRCSLWRRACSARRRSETSRTLATKLSPPAEGVTTMSTGTIPSARWASASTWPEAEGCRPGDELGDVAGDEVGQAAPEQPFRGGVGRLDLPVVAEGDDGVGHGVHDRADALLAGPQRAGDPLRALDGAAAGGREGPDEAEDEEAAQAASDQDEEALAARLVGLEGGQGRHVQGQGTARHRHRALVRQRLVARAGRAQGRRGVVEEGLRARRDPVVDLEVHLRGDGHGDGGDDVVGANRRVDPALQRGAPPLHRGRRGSPGVDGGEEHEAGGALGILDEGRLGREHGATLVAGRFRRRAAAGVRAQIEADGGGVREPRLDVEHGEVVRARADGAQGTVQAVRLHTRLEGGPPGVRHVRDVAEGLDPREPPLGIQRRHVGAPIRRSTFELPAKRAAALRSTCSYR